MGKIIKFDPERRRKRNKPNWTRPEDYGAAPPPPAPKPRRAERRDAAPGPLPVPSPTGRTATLAKLAVAAIILAAVLVSLLGLS